MYRLGQSIERRFLIAEVGQVIVVFEPIARALGLTGIKTITGQGRGDPVRRRYARSKRSCSGENENMCQELSTQIASHH